MPRLSLSACLVLFVAALGGCASNGSGGGSSAYVGTSFYYGHGWYDNPAYWYDSPDYIVVPPGDGDRPERPVRPEHPIAPTDPDRPATRPEPRPAPAQASASSRSRMPQSQPRMSTRSTRASIPRAPRGRR